MSKKLVLILGIVAVLIILGFIAMQEEAQVQAEPIWQVRSIDTVKYSRDVAAAKVNDPTFDSVISKQVSDIASTGASHIAIGTPYDSQFKPFLIRWVSASRNKGLKVWFRGNFSGWEQWFGYKKIDRDSHIVMLNKFITENKDLFEDGDIFTPCPECENGGPGDPRKNGDMASYRKFLIDEYQTSEKAFGKIGKKVTIGYFSMNYDVASLIMDPETTQKLGRVVVIDHYVSDPAKLASDAKTLADKTGGKVVLGEFGAPIPDINGQMSQDQQANWIDTALKEVSKVPQIIGINYWVGVGGSTQLWQESGQARKAVEVLSKYYHQTNKISPK